MEVLLRITTVRVLAWMRLEAFMAARRALRKRYPSPFHWAPFVYLGDPR